MHTALLQTYLQFLLFFFLIVLLPFVSLLVCKLPSWPSLPCGVQLSLEWPQALSFPTSFPLKHFCHCHCHQVYSSYSKSTSCHWEWLHLSQWIWIQQHDTKGMVPCICKLLGTDQFAIMVSGWTQRTPFFWQLRSRISTWSKASW